EPGPASGGPALRVEAGGRADLRPADRVAGAGRLRGGAEREPPMTATSAPPRPIRVLIVEDSPFMRAVIGQLVHSDPQLRVVGQVADGLQAVDAVSALAPDVVTMDVHMPRADGLAAVARIMSERPTPILMLSAATREGSVAAIRALELGAVDFLAKP